MLMSILRGTWPAIIYPSWKLPLPDTHTALYKTCPNRTVSETPSVLSSLKQPSSKDTSPLTHLKCLLLLLPPKLNTALPWNCIMYVFIVVRIPCSITGSTDARHGLSHPHLNIQHLAHAMCAMLSPIPLLDEWMKDFHPFLPLSSLLGLFDMLNPAYFALQSW